MLTGTIASSDPASQANGLSNSDDGDHLRLNLTSVGTIQGRAKFESPRNGSDAEFQVEVWNGTADDQLAVVVDGVTVGQITINRRGFGELRFENGDDGGVFLANWPGISDGSTVTVGAELSGNFSGAGRVTDASPAEFDEAYDLDHRLELERTADMFENWGGLGEKWLRGKGGWYFITPDGSFYHWTRGSGMNGELVAGLDSRYHADPTLLTEALQGLSVDEAAYAIDHGLNLRTTPSDFFNRGGRNEKWLRGDGGWYFITEDGGFYSWDGKPAASGILIMTLSATYYNDLSLLASTTSGGREDIDGLLDNVFADVSDLLHV